MFRQLSTTALVALGSLAFAGASHAATCTPDPVTRVLHVDSTTGEWVSLRAAADGVLSGDASGSGAFDCAGATTWTVAVIQVSGAEGVTLDARAHTLDVQVQLDGSAAYLTYMPPPNAPLHLAAGKKGLALDERGVVGVTYGKAMRSVTVYGSDVSDDVTASGGFGTGAALPKRAFFEFDSSSVGAVENIVGHDGLDRIFLEGSSQGTVHGLAGRDFLNGGTGAGPYVLDGGGDGDTLGGQTANTTLLGGTGLDVIELFGGATGDGGDGNDIFEAADGAAETILGGPGKDTADVDATDSVTDVERIHLH
jgi:hypothetical protein